jgi:sec-independent protein translocase protein TatB
MNPLSSIGTGELILVLIIALIFLGPERLPEIARKVGETVRQFRGALDGMRSEFGEELASVEEMTKDLREGVKAVEDVRKLPQTLAREVSKPLTEATAPVREVVKEAQKAVRDSTASIELEVGRIGGSVEASASEPDESEVEPDRAGVDSATQSLAKVESGDDEV